MQRFATKFKYFDKATSPTPLFVSIIMTYLSVCGLFYQLEVGCEGNGDVTGIRLFLTSGARGQVDSCCEFSLCCAPDCAAVSPSPGPECKERDVPCAFQEFQKQQKWKRAELYILWFGCSAQDTLSSWEVQQSGIAAVMERKAFKTLSTSFCYCAALCACPPPILEFTFPTPINFSFYNVAIPVCSRGWSHTYLSI